MQQSNTVTYPQEIMHPPCNICGLPMWLVGIEPDKSDYDKRTFECQTCKTEIIEIVKYG